MVTASHSRFGLSAALTALVVCVALLAGACNGAEDASELFQGDASAPSLPDANAPPRQDAAPAPAAASLRVADATSLRTGEDGTRAAFTVALGSRPTSAVIVPLASSNVAETTLDPSALTFTPDDWATPKTVTLFGQNDDVADGDQRVTITLGPASSADAAYNGLRGEDVTVTNADDDIAAIEVSAPYPSANTTEPGGQTFFAVRLQSQPLADVTVAIGSTRPAEGVADVTQLVFTPVNWSAAQTVTVTGVDDPVADGDQPYVITLAKAQSLDPVYAAINPPDVALVNQDDDIPGFLVSGAVPSASTTEAGGAITFTVRLRSKPLQNVSVPVSSTKPTEGTPSVTALAFTPANYAVAQTVTVTGVDDKIDDGDQPYTIALGAATSADALYAGLDPPDVALTNLDDDTAAVLVSAPLPGAQTTEAGGKITFTVKLGSEPLANVTIGISSSKPAEGAVDKAQVVFTPATWNVAQTVTVTGVDDLVADGNVPYTIVLAKAVSADPKYAAIDPADVALVNVDNDTAGISVGLPQPGATTTEGGAKVTVAVVLQSQPTADVTIPVSSSKPAEGAVDKAQLVFTAANWNVAQTITVTGVDDKIDDGDQAYTLVLGAAVSADALYGAINPADVALTNLDDDTAGLVVSAPLPSNKTTECGAQLTFTVALQSQPLANVTVPVTSTKPTEGTPDKAQLVFTAATWNVPQTVTVTGQADAVVDPDQPYAATVGASVSVDPLYAALSVPVNLINVGESQLQSDPLHCGVCGYACVHGRTCVAGRCTPAWQPLSTVGVPAARDRHAAAALGTKYVAAGGTMTYQGVATAAAVAYDLATDTWSAYPSLVNARLSHELASAGGKLYAFGGLTDASNGSTVGPGLEESSGGAWASLAPASPPHGRYNFAMAWTGADLMIYGGGDDTGPQNASAARWAPGGAAWTDASCALAGCARGGYYALFRDGPVLHLFGGIYNDPSVGLEYDPAANTWATWAVPAGGPTGAQFPKQPADDGRRIFWVQEQAVCTDPPPVIIYDRKTKTWATDTSPRPAGLLARGAGAWVGKELVVWSGDCGAGGTTVGGRYQPAAVAP